MIRRPRRDARLPLNGLSRRTNLAAGAELGPPGEEGVASGGGDTPGATAPRRLGRYELIERIGRGGMGEVFLARDTQLNRSVAIKALPTDHIPARGDVERFRQEISNLLAVTHPYVAAVYDVIEEGGDLYIVMEHVRGRSLKEAAALDRRPRTIARWGQQVAEALAGIHAAGIVHRDLKPSNVMIAESGHVKVLDFGIAKRFVSQPEHDDGTVETVEELTRRGVVVGPRSDLFSLGVLLYEALTGAHPFRRATPVDTQAAILAGVPGDGVEPSELAQAGPLREVILRLLEKDPAKRFATAGDVAGALDATLSEYTATGTGESRELRRPWRRRPVVLGVLALAAVAALALGVGFLRSTRARDPVLTADQQTLLDRARGLRREHRYREALEVVEAELARSPKLIEFEILQATTLLRAGNERRAREVLDHAQWQARELGIDPAGRVGLELERTRAEILRRGAERVTATEALARRFPETPGIQVDFAEAVSAEGRTDEALAILDRHLAAEPMDANAWLAKGRILSHAGRRAEAEAAFGEAERAFRSLAVPTGAAAVETERGVVAFLVDRRPDEALEHFQQATALYRAGAQPSLEAFSRYQEAGAQLELGNLEEALAGFIEAQNAAAEHGDLSLAAVAQDAHAVVLIRSGRPRDALPLLRATVDQATLLGDFGLSLSAQGNLVAALQNLGRFDEARRAATETLALARQQPDEAGFAFTMTIVLAQLDLEGGKGEAALGALHALAEEQQAPGGSDATRAEAQAALGGALLTLERPGQALSPLEDAVAGWTAVGDKDQLGYALVIRAQAHAEQGRTRQARADLAAARTQAGSGNAGVARNAAWVEGLTLIAEGRPAEAAAQLEAVRKESGASGALALAVDAAIAESQAHLAAHDAAAALRAAREAAQQGSFSPLRQVRAKSAEAEALAALGRHDEARAIAAEAAPRAAAYGLVLSRQRLRSLTGSASKSR